MLGSREDQRKIGETVCLPPFAPQERRRKGWGTHIFDGGVDGGGGGARDTRPRGGVRGDAAAADRLRRGEEDACAGGDRVVREWRDTRYAVRGVDLHDGGPAE